MVNVFKNNPKLALKKIKEAIIYFEAETKGEPASSEFYQDKLQETYYIVRDIANDVNPRTKSFPNYWGN